MGKNSGLQLVVSGLAQLTKPTIGATGLTRAATMSVGLLVLTLSRVWALEPEVLYSFSSGLVGPVGPGSLIQGPDGNLYGTTTDASSVESGGTSGEVIRITTNGVLTTLATIDGPSGGYPVTPNPRSLISQRVFTVSGPIAGGTQAPASAACIKFIHHRVRFEPIISHCSMKPRIQVSKKNERKTMNNKFDELAKGLAQSVTRRQALKRFSVGLAGMALACFGLAGSAEAGSCLPSGNFICVLTAPHCSESNAKAKCCSHSASCNGLACYCN